MIQQAPQQPHLRRVLCLSRQEGTDCFGRAEEGRGNRHEAVNVSVDPARVMPVLLDPLHKVEDEIPPHRVRNDHGLLPIHLDKGLNRFGKPRKVPVPLLQLGEREPPVVGRHVHRRGVVPDVCQVLDELGPHPVPPQHKVGGLEALRRPQLDALGVEARGRVEGHVPQPAARVEQHVLHHRHRAPHPLPEVLFCALLPLPQLQARRHDPRHHHDRVLGPEAVGVQLDAGSLEVVVELRGVGRCEVEETLQLEELGGAL
mmetsp:Transcript_34674/g.87617  ORF Transcript_34674/g.87617 Transcript_34674/m.87617 type:complete len:258 (-) Transcript_34674:189-962(-)